MAGKRGSGSVFFLVDGYRLTAMKLQTLSDKTESITELAHGLGDTAESSDPVNMLRTTITIGGGFFDTASNSGHAALSGGLPSTPQSVPRLVCIGFDGQDVGAPFVGRSGEYSHTYEVMSERGALTKANAEFRVAGAREPGVIVQPLAAQTVDWDTEATPVDYTTDTTQRVIPITSNSQANPTTVTTPVPHGLTSGDVVLISGVAGSNADVNGEHAVTVVTPLTFTVAVNAGTSGGTGGQFVRANSANGGAGYLQVTACSGFSGFVGRILDSDDDSTYAELVEFADNVSAPFAERVTVAGTVERYLAFDGDVTGSGSITVFAGFARW